MAIGETSRYRNSLVMRVPNADGEVRPAIYHLVSAAFHWTPYRTYITVDGDRLDLLASRLYGDATLWWVIADMNPEYFFAEQLPVGVPLRVPEAP